MFLSPLKVYLCPYTHIQHIHVSTCLSAQQQSTCPETGIKESATKFHTHTLIFTYEFCGEVDQRDEKENYTTRCAPLSFYLVSLSLSISPIAVSQTQWVDQVSVCLCVLLWLGVCFCVCATPLMQSPGSSPMQPSHPWRSHRKMVRETRHLWVGNLPEPVREDRIREHFKRLVYTHTQWKCRLILKPIFVLVNFKFGIVFHYSFYTS